MDNNLVDALRLRDDLLEDNDDEPEQEEEQTQPKKPKPFEKKVQDAWIPKIMEWIAQGNSLSKVSKLVEANYGTKICTTTIHQIVKKIKSQRADSSKMAVRENLGNIIVSDLEIIKTKKAELVALSNTFKDGQDWKNYYMAIDRIKELSKMLFDLCGINEKELNSDAENAKNDLIDLFEKFDHR